MWSEIGKAIQEHLRERHLKSTRSKMHYFPSEFIPVSEAELLRSLLWIRFDELPSQHWEAKKQVIETMESIGFYEDAKQMRNQDIKN